MARKDEFNRDMDSYLRHRKVIRRVNPFLSAKSYFMNMFRTQRTQERKEVTPNDQGDLTPEQVQAVLATSAVKPVTVRPGIRNTAQRTTIPPPTAAPQPARPAQKKVKSMGWFSRRKEEEDYEEVAPAQPVLDEDVREVLKITFKWLKQMDPEQVEEIKNSADFEKYKRVLDKYGLIKK